MTTPVALHALPLALRADETATLLFQGPAWRTVQWTLTGPGTLTALAACTDAAGRATARYVPDAGSSGPVTVQVACGVEALPESSLVLSIQPATVRADQPVRIAWSSANLRGAPVASGVVQDLSGNTTGTDVRYSTDYPATSTTAWDGTMAASGELPAVYLQADAYSIIVLKLSAPWWNPGEAVAQAQVRLDPAQPPLTVWVSAADTSGANLGGIALSNTIASPAGSFVPDPVTTVATGDGATAVANVQAQVGCVWSTQYTSAANQDYLMLRISTVETGKRVRVSTITSGITLWDFSTYGDSATPIITGTNPFLYLKVSHNGLAAGSPVLVNFEVID